LKIGSSVQRPQVELEGLSNKAGRRRQQSTPKPGDCAILPAISVAAVLYQ